MPVIMEALFFLLLARTVYTDITKRKIENIVLLLLLINRVILYGVNHVTLYSTTKIHWQDEFVRMMTHLLVIVLVISVYSFLKEYMGAGDVKLLCVCVLYIAPEDFILWILLILAALFAYAILMAIKRKRIGTIPFAPFVFLGTIGIYVFRMLQG